MSKASSSNPEWETIESVKPNNLKAGDIFLAPDQTIVKAKSVGPNSFIPGNTDITGFKLTPTGFGSIQDFSRVYRSTNRITKVKKVIPKKT